MRFRLGFEQTMLAVVRSRELLSTIILAVLLYGFYYPAPYAHQTVQGLPIVIVDEEDSVLTRSVIRDLTATREVRLIAIVPNFHAAEMAVRERRADGILLFPDGFTRSLLTGASGGGVGVWVDGAYLLRARDIGVAVTASIAGVAKDRLGPSARSLGIALPFEIVVRPLFNTREGYKDYVFPAVGIIILQQTLLFGSAAFMAQRRERGAWQIDGPGFAGMWLAFTTIGTLAALLYFGLIFWIQDVPRGGNIAIAVLAAPIFAAAVSALGLLLGSLMERGYRAMQILVPTSVPLFFLTGSAWPLESMPHWVAVCAYLSPATAGVHLFVRLNQMGANLDEVAMPLVALIGTAALYGLLSALRISLRQSEISHG
ncbi:ABC transporter permease [Sphingomonas abietis]|uniref:ABC transporter permease n=1 Tax=Sphingomonas abietis TaxID=3012344 RepID=A0ABY7NRR9_9SPHN|nr:ABC transporter permease [Sphingomonas abietis]WBO23882.1 ABC transporter permease [Sphingomonas abietis]